MERKYYLAIPGGVSAEAIAEWQRAAKKANDKSSALCEEFGAIGYFRSRREITGFVFKGHPGAGWLPAKELGAGAYRPHRITKIGKALAARIDAIVLPDNSTFAKLLGGGYLIFSARTGRFASAGFQQIGDDLIISVPVGSGESFVPPDTTVLKLSEYYALKEAEETHKESTSSEITA